MVDYLKKNYRKVLLIASLALTCLLSFIVFVLSISELIEYSSASKILLIPIFLEIACLVFSIIGIVKICKNQSSKLYFYFVNISISLILMIMSGKFYIDGILVCEIFKFLFGGFGIVFVFINLKEFKAEEPKGKKEKEAKEEKNITICDWVALALNIVAIVLNIVLFFIPFYEMDYEEIVLGKALISDEFNAVNGISGFAFLILFILLVANFTKVLSKFICKDDEYRKTSKFNMMFALVNALIFNFSGKIIVFSTKADYSIKSSTASLVMAFIVAAVAIVHSVFVAKSDYDNKDKKEEKKASSYKLIILIFTAAMCLLTFASLFSEILTINVYDNNEVLLSTIDIKGSSIIKDYATLPVGLRLVAFVLYVMLMTVGSLLICSIIGFASKSRYFKGVSMVAIITSISFTFMLSLFGLYFIIVNQIEIDSLTEIFATYGIDAYFDISKIHVSIFSSIFWIFLCEFVIGAALLAVKPFSKFDIDDIGLLKVKNVGGNSGGGSGSGTFAPSDDAELESTFDACPAFSEIDSLKPSFDLQASQSKKVAFNNPTLPNLVKYIVDYARESRLHLSYSLEDIASFIAGLGITRLSILQGMSGTGKTSLPKIFMEAIKGNCEIVEVESSWKDKNELLGYYNEFSKVYSPKKFTQALYKAKLNPQIVTFIVLDEMNLSRIEYYFSDFLSLMENEEDKREIKLLNTKIYNIYDNERHSFSALTNDHTIKIPTNVWFIGTANRDESTFEISDKVYDRANTMNFNKRAPKVKNFMAPIPQQYVSYDTFKKLLEDAKQSFNFDLDDYKVVKDVEKLLEPYNISFGNRVQKQIEEYVKVYCSCFNNPTDLIMEALEKILLTKVVSKLEFKSVENKEALVREFEKLKLYACSEFVSKLNEDY